MLVFSVPINYIYCAHSFAILHTHAGHAMLSGMRFLGIDYGTKRIGVAISDESGSVAFPHATIENDRQVHSALDEIIKAQQVQTIVVGESKALDGTRNRIQEDIDAFVHKLTDRYTFPVALEPEYFTSIEARRSKEDKQEPVDAQAASIILQSYLDRHRTSSVEE